MPQIYVHYFVDATFGITQLHFSGSENKPNAFIKNKTLFNLAQIGIQQINPAQKLWDATEKLWHVHNTSWITLMPYYTQAPEIYGMVPYLTKASFEAFMSGKVANFASTNIGSESWRSAVSEAEAAQSFFNTQAFNHAVTKTAGDINDRETLITLLGLTSWTEFDSLDKSAARKKYLQAVRKFHPDFNSGNGSKMSRLNELWAIYGGVK